MIRIFIVKDSNNKYICLNVDNDEAAQNLLNNGAKEVPQEQVKEIFGDYANKASPLNTTVSEDGELISFDYTPPTLEQLKQEKLQELSSISHTYDDQLVNNDMFIVSSLGFKANADIRSQNNIKGLIAVGTEPVTYKDYDNQIQSLTLANLNTLLTECSLNGQNLYAQKWTYQSQINTCETKEQLEAIKFEFTMLDFSN